MATSLPSLSSPTIPCPDCQGAGYHDCSGPGLYAAADCMRGGFAAQVCKVCDGSGEVPACEHGHACDADGYCASCDQAEAA